MGKSSSDQILSISFKDVDPEFTFQVLDRIVGLLENRFRDLTIERVERKKAFIEARLQEVDGSLVKAQNDIAQFQSEYGILDLTSQMAYQGRMISDLQSEILSAEMQIQSLKSSVI